MTSNSLNRLQKELANLSNGLLPSDIEQMETSYDEKKWEERVKGYIVLVHSAFENYLEDVAIEILDNAYKDYASTNKPNNILVSLVLYYKIHWPLSDVEGNECNKCFWRKYFIKCIGKCQSVKHLWTKKESFNDAIKNIRSKFIELVINTNHGVSSKYITNIFIPLSLDIKLIDHTFKTDLDTFCSIRGRLAHTTNTSGTTIISSPSAVKNEIDKLLGGNKGIWGFKEFDELVMNLL